MKLASGETYRHIKQETSHSQCLEDQDKDKKNIYIYIYICLSQKWGSD